MINSNEQMIALETHILGTLRTDYKSECEKAISGNKRRSVNWSLSRLELYQQAGISSLTHCGMFNQILDEMVKVGLLDANDEENRLALPESQLTKILAAILSEVGVSEAFLTDLREGSWGEYTLTNYIDRARAVRSSTVSQSHSNPIVT